ncbi:hypothetical protein BCU68_11225 [Vibrio sp. 10N.286.49.B3]|uniref:PilZ domain-containing protein n=1 Tax=Vibrio sp. 10N.286.49.B3 TaxID=1880855 RepID=UPI000C85449F|nr:PilZ domain-containing protein [Vibrio sp. 10N.286.49.B3]PMH45008.1 hypothetical protein BCU68_11225 [Vibrio sp. 10N.286.49.B3]
MTEQEYFSVHHSLTVNVEPLAMDFILPTGDAFEAEIPAPFIVASEFSHLDTLTDSAKQELKSNDFKHVIQLLDTQNSKLNLLLSFMLSQQDEALFRHKTLSFGASQMTYLSEQALAMNTPVRVKLFLDTPAAAIYCYGHVISAQLSDNQNNNVPIYAITIKYQQLRDCDQDLLIKAALFQQQKLLRQRSLEREQQN